jgi:hypothetical protein
MKKPFVLLIVILVSFLFFFAAAKNNSSHTNFDFRSNNDSTKNSASLSTTTESAASLLFSELQSEFTGLKKQVFVSAIHGMQKLNDKGYIRNTGIISIIDFSQPSNQKRLYVVDLKNKHVLFNTLVAHGKNSGTILAKSFSNQSQSLKSSPGFYITGETYFGDHGYSLRLEGQEKNINDNAESRAIVIHGADYVDQSVVDAKGYLGRSWGCPAIPVSQHKIIIDKIKEGTCLFIYTSDKNYQQNSFLLN